MAKVKEITKKIQVSYENLISYLTTSKIPQIIWSGNFLYFKEQTGYLKQEIPFNSEIVLSIDDKNLLSLLTKEKDPNAIVIKYKKPYLNIDTTSKISTTKKFSIKCIEAEVPEYPYSKVKFKNISEDFFESFKAFSHLIHPKLRNDESFFCYVQEFLKSNTLCIGSNNFIITRKTQFKELENFTLNNTPLKYIIDSGYKEDVTFKIGTVDKIKILQIVDKFHNYEICFKLIENLISINSKLGVLEKLEYGDTVNQFKVDTSKFTKIIQELIANSPIKDEETPFLTLKINDNKLNISYSATNKKVAIDMDIISNINAEFVIQNFSDKFLDKLDSFISSPETTFYITHHNNYPYLYFQENDTTYLTRINDLELQNETK